MLAFAVLILGVGAAAALPHETIIRKLDPGLRYQFVEDGEGVSHLTDLWGTTADLAKAARYNPATDNVYHLFTRSNPQVSQPLLHNRPDLLAGSNFDPSKKTVVLVHGWNTDLTGIFGTVMINGVLAAGDVNVIALDWTAGSSILYPVAMANVLASAAGVASFINWLNAATGAVLSDYHIIGHSLGGQQVGSIGRNLGGQVPYITSLDPAIIGWANHPEGFEPNVALYTEVIHTNAGLMGALSPIGHVDFYPNGGVNMPGCVTPSCNHDRCIYYLAESLQTGGFTGRECPNYLAAITNDCNLPGTLKLGGWEPKFGSTGIYRMDTNAYSPFSQG